MRFTILALIVLSSSAFGHDEVTPKPKLLQHGVPLEALSGVQGEFTVYKVVVPANVEFLTIRSRGRKGDCDLLVRRGAHPSDEEYDYASQLGGSDETVRVSAPGEGPWYVAIDAFSSYQGVQLTADYELKRGAVAVPRFSPAPGIYAETVSVHLRCQTKGAVIRYTIDGSEPTAASPIYSKVLTFTADTRLRVKAFGKNGVASPEQEGYYFLHAKGEVTTLANAEPRHFLAGMAGTSHLFKLAVEAGQNALHVTSEGGVGNVDLFVKRGAPPTSKDFDRRSARKTNREGISIQDPVAGDYYILMRGRANFSGVSLTASSRSAGVDLIAWQPALDPYVTVESFDPESCEVQEGMIEPGTHTLLRFSTETRNIGGDDLVMPNPVGNPAFEFQDCHGHYHFKGFARYRLLDSDRNVVALGKKVSFCLLDLERWDPSAAEEGKFDCQDQGIQSGWADVYDSGLPGQWIEITGIPPGTYTLEVTMNADQILEEVDYTNNSTSIEVTIEP
jgi:hypothetical protein